MPTHASTPVRVFERPKRSDGSRARVPEYYGRNVFDISAMQQRMTQQDIEAVRKVMQQGGRIAPDLAERLATAVREWASEKGATHYCHWFQPQTGATAEKHEGFVGFDQNGRSVDRFSGKELLQGEPDASSFPSGGLRSTFEARGYSGWDPSSPMFVMESENGVTLYVPSVFVGHNGEALDYKTPLLRSLNSISTVAAKTLTLLGETGIETISVNIGAEQEFFLVERDVAAQRPDLVLSGRTVFGKKPAKGQELEDHYFGHIPPRVHAFMEEVETELYKLGVPLKTRHNEVAPRQFEFAPIYEGANIASDHNHLLMKVLRSVASRHGYMVLLHEKPFQGVNGSGKHVNWSLEDNKGRNLLDPGKTPHDNIVFLTFLTGVLLGVYRNADVLRASIATAGNDHRLGANEAPPAIISVFLGEALDKIVSGLESGQAAKSSAEKQLIDLGLAQVQNLLRETTDRNRTSPVAFTGNKFEFRAVGSSAPIGFPVATLNAAVADGLQMLNAEFESKAKNGTVSPEIIMETLSKHLKTCRAIRFEGNGYSQEWRDEAARRGLGNYPTTPDALGALLNPERRQCLGRVFSDQDLESRAFVQLERYIKQRAIEANVAIEMVQSGILPAATAYQTELVHLAREAQAASIPSPALRMATEVGNLCNRADASLNTLKLAVEKTLNGGDHDNLLLTAKEVATTLMPKLEDLRVAIDQLETVMPAARWPYPQYSDLLFTVEN
jgi:glutamine synthetase